MLIVMEDRDIAFLFELLLNLKAARGCYVFQIDPAKASAYLIDRIDDRIDIFALKALLCRLSLPGTYYDGGSAHNFY